MPHDEHDERDERDEHEHDRDRTAVHFAKSRGAGRERLAPSYGYSLSGGALRKATDAHMVSGREDAPLRGHMMLGFARYQSPSADTSGYRFRRLGVWRVAIRPGEDAARVLGAIAEAGPQRAGYVRVGDTLVPRWLSPGERMALASRA